MKKIYSFGYGATAISILESRTIQKEADVFLKYLNPSMKLLDIGCGPGNLTIGFAQYLKDGHVWGVDLEATQVQLATEKCLKAQIENCQFQVGSITNLSFDDETFDAIWCSNLLLNFNEHTEITAELNRVLKPNGIIGIVELHSDGYLIYPKGSATDLFFELQNRSVAFNGGDPNVGERLPQIFSQNGFEIIEVTKRGQIINTMEERLIKAKFCAGLWEEAEFPELAVKQNWITEQQRKMLAKQIVAEANNKDHFYDKTVIKIVARKVSG